MIWNEIWDIFALNVFAVGIFVGNIFAVKQSRPKATLPQIKKKTVHVKKRHLNIVFPLEVNSIALRRNEHICLRLGIYLCEAMDIFVGG